MNRSTVHRHRGLVSKSDAKAHVGLRVGDQSLPGVGLRSQGGRRHLRRHHSSPVVLEEEPFGRKDKGCVCCKTETFICMLGIDQIVRLQGCCEPIQQRYFTQLVLQMRIFHFLNQHNPYLS